MLLTESDIAALLAEPKALPRNAATVLKRLRRLKRIRRLQSRLVVAGQSGRRFELLALKPVSPDSKKFTIHVRLRKSRRRYTPLIRLCGPGSRHTNFLEASAGEGVQTIPHGTCHIHRITERYQRISPDKAMQYAEPTNEFDSFESAVEFVLYRYGFYMPIDPYRTRYPLFGE